MTSAPSAHRTSYQRFCSDILPRLLKELFPPRSAIEFVDLSLEESSRSEEECRFREETYSYDIVARFRADQGERVGRVAALPRLTDRDTLVVRGVERTPLMQLRLKPGLYFTVAEEPRRTRYAAMAVPSRGLWIRIVLDRIDGDWIAAASLGEHSSRSLARQLGRLGLLDDARNQFASDDILGPMLRMHRQDAKASAGDIQLLGAAGRVDLGDEGRLRFNERVAGIAALSGLTPCEGARLEGTDVLLMLHGLVAQARGEEQADSLGDLRHRRVLAFGDHLEECLDRVRSQLRQVVEVQRRSLEVTLAKVRRVFDDAVERYLKGPLCQILDETNPAAELAQKRKVTYLGHSAKGGARGGRAEWGHRPLRAVHPSHYGRLCLIETPETDHIGLDLYLTRYARVTESGSIESPARTRTGEEVWLSPEGEGESRIAPAEASVGAGAVPVRYHGEVCRVDADQITHSDCFRDQSLGYSASLVPFLAHNDLNRGMMGAKNMKQALPLLHAEIPLVTSGSEEIVAKLSGRRPVAARAAGEVMTVSSSAITVRKAGGAEDRYALQEVTPTPQRTFVGHTSCVAPGDRIEAGTVLADAAGTKQGVLALGMNCLVAYMPWHGYNFEDAIVVSDRLVEEDLFTSYHVEELSFPVWGNEVVRLNRRGREGTRRPGLEHLSEEGAVKPGTRVEPGVVLLRKWKTVRGWENDPPIDRVTPERCQGTVVRVIKVPLAASFGIAKAGLEIDDPNQVREIVRIWVAREARLSVGDKLTGRHGNKGVVGRIVPRDELPHLEDGTPVDVVLNPHGVISRMNLGQLFETHLGWVARKLGCRFVAPPFGTITLERCDDPAIAAEVQRILAKGGDHVTTIGRLLELANSRGGVQLVEGKAQLLDGRGGKPIAAPVTVGVQYLLKLNHLAQSKLAARDEGRYLAVTRQPSRGGGGQRMGEMEVWALEAHNAPTLLREALTLRSDDVRGRVHLWTQRDMDLSEVHVPESLRATAVLLRGLALNMELLGRDGRPLDLAYASSVHADDLQAVRVSLASAADIRGWGRELKDPRAWETEEVWVYRCTRKLCDFRGEPKVYKARLYRSRVKGKRAARPEAATCPQCGAKALPYGRESRSAFSETGPFGNKVFGASETERRLRMAYLKLAVPVIHPLFASHLEGICGGALEDLVTGQKVFLVEEGNVVQGDAAEALAGPIGSAGAYARQRLVSSRQSGNDAPAALEHGVLDVLPVIPPDLRPFRDPAETQETFEDFTSDLNRLYERVFSANSRVAAELKRTLVVPRRLVSAMTALQQAVNELLMEGWTDPRGRHYRGVGELVGGKEGMLRHALLGKRTDYSGRAVIVPGPKLELDACELPYPIAQRLLSKELGRQERGRPERQDRGPEGHERTQALLDGRVVLLNRAPSLHRYNVMAFRPRVTDSPVIGLCPLVCAGFNADFDGDTIAVHLPVQSGSQREARERCLATGHLRSIASGRLTLHLAQDIVSGAYLGSQPQLRPTSADTGQVIEAAEALAAAASSEATRGSQASSAHTPSPGAFKEALTAYLEHRLDRDGPAGTGAAAEEIMRWGFAQATRGGLTLGLFDIPSITAPEREAMREGLAPEDWEAWCDRVGRKIEQALRDGLRTAPPNPMSVMVLTGARGDIPTALQLGGQRLLDQPGRRFQEPVTASFLEGLGATDFFLSAFAARKTMVDKKLVVAEAGDLTRRLVEAGYGLVVSEEGPCADDRGIEMRELERVDPTERQKLPGLGTRLLGRVLAQPVDVSGERLASSGQLLTRGIIDRIVAAGLRTVRVRSPITCMAPAGLCASCYGWDLSTSKLPELGLPVGLIAGQSIGERGTQLTLRTFHRGGVKGEDITRGLPRVRRLVEGWADLLQFLVHPEGGSEVLRDEWAAASTHTRLQGPPEPLVDTSGRQVTVSLRLDDLVQERGLPEVAALFAWLFHRVYGGAVDDRHLEVVFRAMMVDGHVVGVTRAAAAPTNGLLRAASFRAGLQVLAAAALEERTDPLAGYKERLMTGKALRE